MLLNYTQHSITLLVISLVTINLSAQKELLTLTGHKDFVFSVSYNPDGKYIVSGSKDHTIKIWQASNGTLLSSYTGHGDAVSSI